MKLRFTIFLLLAIIAGQIVYGASVRRRYVPSSDVDWGGSSEFVEAEFIKPREVKFIHYGGVIEISSEVAIDKVEVYSISGIKLAVKRVRSNQATINAGDFDYGFYIVVTSFVDGSKPTVNKFIR